MHKLLIIIAAIFTGFIFWVLYMANTNQHTMFFDIVRNTPYGDKIGHVLLFGLLTLFLNLATKSKTLPIKNFQIYLGSFAVFIFVTVEELSQYFLPSRTLDMIDYVANLTGIMSFSLATMLINKKHLTSQGSNTPSAQD